MPKLGWLRYRNSRDVLGELRSVTVSLSCGRWYVSILTRREVAEPVHPASSIVGIDMGVAHFATLSTGEHIEPLNSFKRHQTALRKAGQALSRKVKYSKNWKKAKARVQRIHFRIGNARRDFLHKATTTISKNHAVVCIEDLQVQNMSKSATGSAEKPGKNVRTKAGLNRSILDQGWFEFRRQLEYKQAWRGGMVIAVDPRNTSRTCPCCDHVSAENRQTQARFECVECGFEENADVVGAINILARGHAVLRGERQDHARIACEVSGAVMPPVAGTPPKRSNRASGLNAVGILGLQAGEDVKSVLKSEHGAALILALLMTTMLALLGVWSAQTSVLETHIASNDKLQKIAFHKASGGAEAGIELIEQNIEERGFPVEQVDGLTVCARRGIGIDLVHSTASFFNNADIGAQKPSCTNRDAFIPTENLACTPPITNLRIGGNATLSTGGAIQMIAGYEGKGKGAAGGGGWVTYDIRAQHLGADHSESVVNLRWRHVF